MVALTHSQLLTLAGHQKDDQPYLVYTHLETDSRKVDEAALFFALPGVTSHGWDYLDNVAEKGCQTVVIPDSLNITHPKLTLIPVPDPRKLLIECLYPIFGSTPEHIVAVTGTNGKSSICYYLAQLAQKSGMVSGLIGTFGMGPLDCLEEALQTTPDVLSLHKTLISLHEKKVSFVAFEASSHALDQGRLYGVPVQTAIFSNLSRDHLDYHGDMAAYAKAKSQLFSMQTIQNSIFCLDDPYTPLMLASAHGNQNVFYSEHDVTADFYIQNLMFLQDGSRFTLCHPQGESEVFLPLLGRFNIQNALAALAGLWSKVEDKDLLISNMASLQGAPGRMEKIYIPKAPLIVVDYSHTPDSLRVALQALKEHTGGRLICVFGCGGDRDKGKRPLMMKAALENANVVWLTSDNPRTESPQQILDDALEAASNEPYLNVEIDRSLAIHKAIMAANKEDVILIAGKGHETYQDIQGVKHHFDDREEALKGLKNYVA